MTTETIERLKDYCYASAKSKGFYTEDIDDVAYIAAIHEELCEAFHDWNTRDIKEEATWYADFEFKPEGIYVELADAVIRTLSFCGYKGYALHGLKVEDEWTREDFCEFICKAHVVLGQYYEIANQELIDEHAEKIAFKCIENVFSNFINLIESFIESSDAIVNNSDLRLTNVISEKLNYNRVREMKHGGHIV